MKLILHKADDAAAQYEYKYGLIFLFVLNTGLQRGEALGLTWKDIDFKRKLCSISRSVAYIKDRSSKGDSNFIRTVNTGKIFSSKRTIELSDETIFYLSEFKKIQEEFGVYAPNNPVLTSKNGEPVSERNFTKSFHAILKKANIRQRGIQSLRDTFAKYCFENNYDLLTVHELLGNKTLETTEKIKLNITKLKEQKVHTSLSF